MLVIDTGFHSTKAQTAGRQVIFPSVTSLATNGMIETNLSDGLAPADLIHFDGASYIIGSNAYDQGNFPGTTLSRSRLMTDETMALIFSAILRLTKSKQGDIEIPELAVSIPDEWYLASRKELATHIRGKHEIAYGQNKKARTIILPLPKVLPQSLGAYASQVYHLGTGNKIAKANGDIADGPCIVCDIGHGTINLATYGPHGVYRNANPTPKSPMYGVHKLIELGRTRIYERTGTDLSLAQVMDAIKTNQFKVGGELKKTRVYIGDIIDAHADIITGQLRAFVGNGLAYDHLLITSGGANIFGQRVSETFKHPATIISTDPSDVARGLYIYQRGSS